MIISLLADWAATKFQLICPAKLSKKQPVFWSKHCPPIGCPESCHVSWGQDMAGRLPQVTPSLWPILTNWFTTQCILYTIMSHVYYTSHCFSLYPFSTANAVPMLLTCIKSTIGQWLLWFRDPILYWKLSQKKAKIHFQKNLEFERFKYIYP